MLFSKICTSLFLLAFLSLTVKGWSRARRTCSTDPCEATECPRFLNADCQINTDECTAVFVWRGHDVTSRCRLTTCDTRECERGKKCVELVYLPSCLGERSWCQQQLSTRCLPTPFGKDVTCKNVTCGEGMVCNMREREGGLRPVVRCVPAPPFKPTGAPILLPPLKFTLKPTMRPSLELPDPETNLLTNDKFKSGRN